VSTQRKPTPSYLPHKQSGRARAVWTDRFGERHQKLLPGTYDSPESRTAFARLQLELASAPHAAQRPDPEGVTVNEVLVAYLGHADQHHRGPDGKPTGEVQHIKVVCRHVRELYGFAPASDFGPLALKAVRERFIATGWCRKTVNQQVERVRRAFKWAAAEELIPFECYHGSPPSPDSSAAGPLPASPNWLARSTTPWWMPSRPSSTAMSAGSSSSNA
jgi:hypothetical protein